MRIAVLAALVAAALPANDGATALECEGWAAAGECDRNHAYMRHHCGNACQCHGWARAGECDRNAAYMRLHRARACARHTPSPPQPPPPPSQPPLECERWATIGECDANRLFMEAHCADECHCQRLAAGGGCRHRARRGDASAAARDATCEHVCVREWRVACCAVAPRVLALRRRRGWGPRGARILDVQPDQLTAARLAPSAAALPVPASGQLVCARVRAGKGGKGGWRRRSPSCPC